MFKRRNTLSLNSEEQLINGCIEQDTASQNKIYKLFAPKMFTVCIRYSRNREDAEDTLQEGFMRVFNNIKSFRHQGSFEGWMRRIIINVAIRKYKDKSNLFTVINIDAINCDTYYEENTLSEINSKELLKLIQELPEKCKMVFNLYVFEGMKHSEIAELLGITIGTSKSNLFDAREILKQEIAKTETIQMTANA
ncbi:MAG: sigma-70 family RNA polymerase sigma factor [Bacteroidetes bacterium]|nr:sigma-70 family RNA polymerase sigma factor [Bacteroidota bacterium]